MRKGAFCDYEIPKAKILNKGDAFGEFNMGSTIVLIFEGPRNMKFDIEPGQKIKYGQLLTFVQKKSEKQ